MDKNKGKAAANTHNRQGNNVHSSGQGTERREPHQKCKSITIFRRKAADAFRSRMGNQGGGSVGLGNDNANCRYVLDGKPLGEGTFGVVYKAKDYGEERPGGGRNQTPIRDVAIKKFKGTRYEDGLQLRELTLLYEISMFRSATHPGLDNIVKVVDLFKNPDEDPGLYMVFEFCEQDLNRTIFSALYRVNELFIKSVLLQVLRGVDFLHSNWIIHRDLKPANILMTSDEQKGLVKLADFGLARLYQGPARPLSDDGVVVTIWYRAPELLLGSKHYTPAIDVWAVGCILGEMLLRHPLFKGQEEKDPRKLQADQLKHIFKCLGFPTVEDWENVVHMPFYKEIEGWKDREEFARPRSLKERLEGVFGPDSSGFADMLDLMTQMMRYDPAKRISAKDAISHKFFKAGNIPTNCMAILKQAAARQPMQHSSISSHKRPHPDNGRGGPPQQSRRI